MRLLSSGWPLVALLSSTSLAQKVNLTFYPTTDDLSGQEPADFPVAMDVDGEAQFRLQLDSSEVTISRVDLYSFSPEVTSDEQPGGGSGGADDADQLQGSPSSTSISSGQAESTPGTSSFLMLEEVLKEPPDAAGKGLSTRKIGAIEIATTFGTNIRRDEDENKIGRGGTLFVPEQDVVFPSWLVLERDRDSQFPVISFDFGAQSFVNLTTNFPSIVETEALYFNVSYEMQGKKLETVSEFFALYNSASGGSEEEAKQRAQVASESAPLDDDEGDDGEDEPTDNGSPGLDSSGKPDGEDEAAQSSSQAAALSAGAIGGIAAAGAVVFLAILGVAIWLLFFRKRKSKSHGKGSGSDHMGEAYDGQSGAHEYAAVDKETWAQPQVTEAPHSPYEAGQPGGSGVHPGTAASIAATQPSPAVSNAAPAASGHESSPRAASATPHGLSRSVAALVEEGMTEDEIRRLEEEERALDAAIAQAGRRS